MLDDKKDPLEPLTPDELARLQERDKDEPLSPRDWERLQRTQQNERYTLT